MNTEFSCDILCAMTLMCEYLPKDCELRKETWRDYGGKLTELHSIVCPSPESCVDFAHMAGADVDMTWDIFKYYKAQGASYEKLKWCRIKVGGLRTKHKGM